jgi:hypothetical protein
MEGAAEEAPRETTEFGGGCSGSTSVGCYNQFIFKRRKGFDRGSGTPTREWVPCVQVWRETEKCGEKILLSSWERVDSVYVGYALSPDASPSDSVRTRWEYDGNNKRPSWYPENEVGFPKLGRPIILPE